MNEADLPIPENVATNSAGNQTGHPGQDAGLATVLEGAAHLSSAKHSPPLADDILHGAEEIAEFIFGERKSRRKIYHHLERGHIPFFKIGNNVCTRKSVLLEWIEEQERGLTPRQNPAGKNLIPPR